MYEIHIKLKKKTQRDLEIIACGLNSKKTKKTQTSAGRRKCEKAFFLIIKKKSAGFGLYLRSDFSVVKMNVSP